MKAYVCDLRQKILRACDHRLGSQRAMATPRWRASQSLVEKWLRQRRATGDIRPRPHAGGRQPICDATAVAHVRQLVDEHSAATLAALAAPQEAQHGLRVRVPTRGRLVLALKRPRTKSRFTPMSARLTESSRRTRPIRKRSWHSTPARVTLPR